MEKVWPKAIAAVVALEMGTAGDPRNGDGIRCVGEVGDGIGLLVAILKSAIYYQIRCHHHCLRHLRKCEHPGFIQNVTIYVLNIKLYSLTVAAVVADYKVLVLNGFPRFIASVVFKFSG